VATAATFGSVALPTFGAKGYNERIVLGSLAAGGTIGIMIPPSVNFIVYGVLAQESIRKLFLAGVFPGLTMAFLFMLTIVIIAKIRPNIAPREPAGPWRERLVGLFAVFPVLVIIFLVLGTIYLGVATPTEAAGFGAAGAFVIALLSKRVNRRMLRETFESTALTAAMIMLIFMATFLLHFVMAHLGVPSALAEGVTRLGLSGMQVVLLIIVFYFALGMIMEAFSMTVATIPIVVPLLRALNVDLVWFGVIVVLMTELALISPPVGLNLFVLHGLRERAKGERDETEKGSMVDVYIGVLPFLAMQILTLALILVFPQIAIWLPSMVGQ
jgi:tripartite ATP-independent transporter DctM subunit